MSKVKIRFLKAGKWGDHPADPVFDVKAGDVVAVSPRLAKLATAGRGAELFVEPSVSETVEDAGAAPKNDKAAPTSKSEKKSPGRKKRAGKEKTN